MGARRGLVGFALTHPSLRGVKRRAVSGVVLTKPGAIHLLNFLARGIVMLNKLILIIGLVGAVNLQCADRGEDSKVSENTGEVIVWNESRSEWGNDAVLMPGTRIGFKYGERVDGLINVGKVHWNSAIRVLPTGSRPASKVEREMSYLRIG